MIKHDIGCYCLLLVSCLITATAWADDKQASSCQDQLTLTSVQANNLANDRAVKEQALAKEQVMTYTLRQQVAQLQKQLADSKKVEQPKVEEPKTP